MIEFTPGAWPDFDGLARLHYRAKPPATIDRVLRAADTTTGETVGVLVTSRPTLNASWRDIAWPGRFSTGTKSERARRLNGELRTISRVIVDPRYRGRGIARQLVTMYLASPATACTEALAAMGTICPFFERAGMRRLETPIAPRDQKLLAILGARRLSALDLVARPETICELERPLRVWARASASTRAIAGEETRVIAREAAARLIAPPAVYAYETD